MAVAFYVRADSVTATTGPSGPPGDMIATGTNGLRITCRRFDEGTDDPGDSVLGNAEDTTFYGAQVTIRSAAAAIPGRRPV